MSVSESVFVFVFEGGQREGAGFAASVNCPVYALVWPRGQLNGFQGCGRLGRFAAGATKSGQTIRP